MPEILERIPGLSLGDIGILYPAAWIGDDVATSAQRHAFAVVRSDTNALFPRSSKLIRWLELCAVWCCGGWRTGDPRFARLVNDGRRIFSEAIGSDEQRLNFQRSLMGILWSRRDGTLRLNTWLRDILEGLVNELIACCRTATDEAAMLRAFVERTSDDGDASAMTLGQFAGDGDGRDRINLSTMHSAKGREFRVVVLFAMDDGRIPRPNALQAERREARRLFYVGFTRPKEELHLLYTGIRPSPFVVEVQDRIADDD